MKISEPGLFLNCAQAAEYIGIGRRSFYFLKNSEGFPKSKRIFGKTDYYLRKDLDDWAKKFPYQEDNNDNV